MEVGLNKMIEIYYREIWIFGFLIYDIYLFIIIKFVKLFEYYNYIVYLKILFFFIVNLGFLLYIN